MSLLLAGALAASALTGGIANYAAAKKTSDTNVQMTEDTNALNEQLTRESWARDDNAVQRRVADLTAAGLSPTLAAGSAAGNSSPIEMKAPQATATSPLQAVGSALEVATQIAQIEQTYASVDKLKADTAVRLEEGKNASDYYEFRKKLMNNLWLQSISDSHSKLIKNVILDESFYDQIDKIKWDSQFSKANAEYRAKQMEIFNETGFDMQSNYGVGNILKLLFPDLSETTKKYGGK